MKMAPLLRALDGDGFREKVAVTLVHTGQHYDANLSDVFFDELGMRRPDISLDVGSGNHAVQTARVLERMEKVLEKGPSEGRVFDRLVVVGDVNSTMAATLAAVKLGVPVAHVEAGLRSFDRSMPEEINRIVTDSLADLLLVSEPTGIDNLRREGHSEDQIHLVGNVMIDTLYHMLPQAKELDSPGRLRLRPKEYGVVTLHRPANVDNPTTLAGLVDVLLDVSSDIPLVFPVHPRTAERLSQSGLHARMENATGLHLLPPMGYLGFLSLISQARVIVTDSGGLQEESTVLGIPCLTLRPNTERPVTVDIGTSTLIGSDPDKLRYHLVEVLDGKYKRGSCPDLWDGHAAERIAKLLLIPSGGKEGDGRMMGAE
jgi:UDP-N-acetylglucosamine 2-epimerase (non-hydrolysing)